MSGGERIADYVREALRLVALERAAEIEETRSLQATLPARALERRGLCLTRLVPVEEEAGLGGRTLVTLARSRGGELPAHRISAGDVVSVREAGAAGDRASAAVTGVVTRVRREQIVVALDRDDDPLPEGALRLDKVANDTTYERMRRALERLARAEGTPAARLVQVCFGVADPEPVEPRSFVAFDAGLDPSQRAAVAFALGSPLIALIHGPPGTGKTTTAAELIRQEVACGHKVLACAPSNVAVDTLLEKLVPAGLRLVRLGHPARLLPAVVEQSLDVLVQRSEEKKLAVEVRRELDRVRKKLRRWLDGATFRALREDVRRLRRELADLDAAAVRHLLGEAQVVLSTATGALDSVLGEREFDLAVVDEAAQALEPACWIPLLRARRAVLVGDACQLPPTVLSREAEAQGLGTTLFERLHAARGERLSRMLTLQYRMHETIMNWSSREFYDGRLEAHAAVRKHRLSDLTGVATTEETDAPLLFIDTAGCDFEEQRDAEGDSKYNEGEARLVIERIEALRSAGLGADQIAVITPYNAQVDLLRQGLARHPGLEIDSVDGFQGREKEAVVISLVRSNPRGEVGFLADHRRLNVAVTRARRHVTLIGDSATIACDPFLARLVDYCQQNGEYRSAWEML
ncbi:MAG: IGHMBP2 family helicase [Planctomycetota bacterium]